MVDDRLHMNSVMEAFYSGVVILERVADWAYMIANRDEVIEIVTSFEKAYEELDALHAAGKLGAGKADFSKENLERVKRLCSLLRGALQATVTSPDLHEIEDLARECLQSMSTT